MDCSWCRSQSSLVCLRQIEYPDLADSVNVFDQNAVRAVREIYECMSPFSIVVICSSHMHMQLAYPGVDGLWLVGI